jgi:PIN domain nuclease of toxin-antitoxin system
MVVLDTCALLWWTLSPDSLSPAARKACAEAAGQTLYISSISVWEIGLKVKKNKLELPLPFPEYVSRLKQISNLTILPVTEDTWAANLALEWDNANPADRTIVATATALNVPIITKDQSIIDYYSRTIW